PLKRVSFLIFIVKPGLRAWATVSRPLRRTTGSQSLPRLPSIRSLPLAVLTRSCQPLNLSPNNLHFHRVKETMRRTLLLIALLLFAYPALAQTKLSEYAGRYTDGTDYVAYFQETPFGLTLRPVLWTATQLLKQESRDEFVVVDRRERG